MNEFDLGKSKTNTFGPRVFRCLSDFVHTHYLVFWLYTKMYSESTSSCMVTWPHPLQLKLTSISGTQTCNGPDWPAEQNNQIEPFVSPLKLFGELFSKKHYKRPPLLQSNGKRVWKEFCSYAGFPVHCALACQILNLEIFTAGQLPEYILQPQAKWNGTKTYFLSTYLTSLKVLNQLAFVLNKVMLPRRAGTFKEYLHNWIFLS